MNGKICKNYNTYKVSTYNNVSYMNNKKRDIDRVMATFDERKILITGASGFVGVVMLERFLRCFSNIGEVCLLMRPKKGKNPSERLREIFSDPFFNLLKSQKSLEEIYSKIKIINGDIMEVDLGLSAEDRKYIIEEISIIYHCAATVRFDESLEKAVLVNTRGTKLMIDLARECKKLEFFGYVSTAYCHAHVKNIIEEKPYPTTIDPLKIIEAVEKLNVDELFALSKKLLQNYANTYVFTKSLAEQLVAETFDELPTVILRPSIVTPILSEPIPGWSNNFNGPVGLLIGAGKGVIRTMCCDPKKIGDMIPVDLVINGILITTWHYLNTEFERIERIYHLTNRNTINETWEDVVEFARQAIVTRSSLGIVVWYPGGSIKKNRLYHNLCFIFTQLIPAFIIDGLLYCFNIPPVLCKVQRRVCQGYEIFEYFLNNEWEFKNDNIYYISKKLNEIEKEKYKTGDIQVNGYKYLEDCTYCSRKYLLKQKDEDIPADQKLLNFMWYLDQICKNIFTGYVVYYALHKIYSFLFK